MLVERRVKVFSVAVSKRQSHTEIDDTFDVYSDALFKDRSDVFFRVVNERKDRCQPHDRRNTSLLHDFEHFDPALGITDIRF